MVNQNQGGRKGNNLYLYFMRILEEIQGRLNIFKELCSNHDVKYLYAFGSAITDKFDAKNSDIDLLVELDEPDPLKRGEQLLDLWDKFEDFFCRRVDLLTESSIRNPILKNNINSSKILVYDGEGQKVLI